MIPHSDPGGEQADYAAYVLDAFGAADYELDAATGTLRHSPRLCELYGYPPGQRLTQADVRARYHPDDDAAIRAIIPDAAASGARHFQREHRLLLPGGQLRWVLSRGEILRDASGAITGVRGAVIDISERRRAEILREEAEAYQRAILDSTSQSVMLIAADFRVLLFNRAAAAAAAQVFGLTMEVGQSILQYVRPDAHEDFRAHFREALAGREVRVEKELPGLSGPDWWEFVYAPTRLPDSAGGAITFTSQRITDRKRAGAQLAASETRLRLALDIAELGTWSWDLATGAGDLDDRAAAIVGLPAGEFADAPTEQRRRVHPDDLPRLEADIAAGMAGEFFSLAYRVVYEDGGVHHVASRARVIRGPGGEPIRLVGINRDVTAERAAERALRESEERYRTLLDSIKQSFCLLEIVYDDAGAPADYRLLAVNRAFERHTGLADPVGRRARELVPDLEQIWVDIYARVAETGEPARFEQHSAAMGRWFEVEAVRVGAAPPHQVALVFTDITARRRAEADVRFLSELGELIRLSDDAGQLLDGAAQMLGRHLAAERCWLAEADPRDRWDVTHEHRAHPALPPLAGRHALPPLPPAVLAELRRGRRAAAADPEWGAVAAVPLRDQERWSATLAASRSAARPWSPDDLALLETVAERSWNAAEKLRLLAEQRASTARLQELYTQEQAARAQAEEAARIRDEFLATVSHELRTPLTAFLGYAQLAVSRQRDQAYIARTVAKMVQSAKAQAALIEDLLDISRIVSGKLRIEAEPVSLGAVVGAALDTVRPSVEAKEQHLSVETGAGDVTVLGDESRLQQVVWNLLANATKFTPAGGRIAVRLARDGGDALLTVSDSGQGIPPDFLPHVFERFRQADSSSQRAHAGLGLGLAIVRHVVELHGGSVSAASDGEGRGATFAVRLPLHGGRESLPAAGHAPGEIEAGIPGSPLDSLRVVVVDDQPAVLDMVAECLAAAGADVRACSSAEEALAQVVEWRPDVLVSDIAMPGRDGYWLIGRLRDLGPDGPGATPAAALTAYVRLEERLRVLAAGFQQYVPKPVDPAELRDVVARLAADPDR